MAQQRDRRSPQKAKLGQNFLVNPMASRAIVEALGDCSGATVVEIGPGEGAITHLLAERAKRLIAVEVDRSLAGSLRAEFSGHTGTPVEILTQDILAVDLSRLVPETSSRLIVVGNLPYYITSDILLHIFAHHAAIERAVLMVQREVAERIVASPGGSDFGLLSATAQMYARGENLFTLAPNDFSPPPKVHSSVLRLTMQPRFGELGVDGDEFLRFLRQVFAQKRKTLANNLRNAGHGSTEIRAALSQCGVDPLTRAEAVPLETIAGLFHAITKKNTPASQ